MTFFDFLRNIKKSGKNDRRRQLQAASLQQDGAEEPGGWPCEVLDSIRIKDDPPSSVEADPESVSSVPDVADPDQLSPAAPDPPSSAPDVLAEEDEFGAVGPAAGSIHAMQERNGGLYRLVKAVHAEDGMVHVVRYAGRFLHVPESLSEMELSRGVDAVDGSFGAEHLPIPRNFFAANSVYVQDGILSEEDVRGHRLYVDSVFDCLNEASPKWLQQAGSYAAWRNDRNAMAVLADRYLVGVDLPRDSKKALYWLNRIVQQGIGIVQPGEQVREEYQILTGGIYACEGQDGSCSLCKIVLKDKHGVQQLTFPAVFEKMPPRLNLVRLLEQAAPTGEEVVHAALSAADFLSSRKTFMGLLPIALKEVFCYRTYLREVFAAADFRPSPFELLLQQAEAGHAAAQLEVAQLCLAGDPAWEVEQDIPEAVRWLTEAANLGHGPAAHALALVCRDGLGKYVDPNQQLCFEWLLYAARLDCGQAQLEAAESCLHGLGCSQDPAMAHAWYSIAASRSSNDLTSEQRSLAKARRQAIEAELAAAQRAKAREHFRQLQELF